MPSKQTSVCSSITEHFLPAHFLDKSFQLIPAGIVRSNAGTTGLLIWAVTLAGILGGGALLVYSTSALAS
jgi:hypothetical protein